MTEHELMQILRTRRWKIVKVELPAPRRTLSDWSIDALIVVSALCSLYLVYCVINP